MQIYYDNMNYSNVVKGSYIVPIENQELIEKAQQDFQNKISKDQLRLKVGKFLTYYFEPINNDKLRLNFMVSVDDLAKVQNRGLQKYSYYSQEHVLCCRILEDEKYSVTEIMKKFMERCQKDGGRMYGPIYYEIPNNVPKRMIFLKIGVSDIA